MTKRGLTLLLALLMFIPLVGTPVFAEEDGIIVTPTTDNCIEFSGWTGSSSLKRYDGKTSSPIGGGTAKFEVPSTLNGWTTLYYWIPKYASGYTENINCTIGLEIITANGQIRKFAKKIVSGNGGEWLEIATAYFSSVETEYINVTGNTSGQNRLTDVKFVNGAKAAYHILPDLFSETGSWSCSSYPKNGAYQDKVMVSTYANEHPAIIIGENLIPGNYYVYVHSVDCDYSTGDRAFYLEINGQAVYKLNETASKSRYFGTHLVGTDIENSQPNSAEAIPYFDWEQMTAPSKTITVGEDGKLELKVHALSGFARFDTIVITQDENFDKTLTGEMGIYCAEPFPAITPYSDRIQFPKKYMGNLTSVDLCATLSNSHTTISFRKGITESGETVVQRKVVTDDVVTIPYENGFGVMSLFATKATGYNYSGYYGQFQTEYPSEQSGILRINDQNVFRSGIPEWIIPETLEQINENTVKMTADGTYASLVMVWTLEENDLEPKVTVTATAKQDGELSFGFFNEVQEIARDKVGYVLNPYRWQESRLPDPGVTITETNSTTDHTQMTYKMNEKGQEISLGVAVDRSSIDLTVPVEGSEYETGRWPHDTAEYTFTKEWNEDKLPDGTYKSTYLDYKEENADFVMNTTGENGGVLPAIFAPKMASIDSSFKTGDTYTFSYRPLSIVSTLGENRGWYDMYKHVAQDLRGVYDYRDNYYSSMTDAAFNILNFLKDDEASGWDSNMIGHYNIEDSNWVTNSNGLSYLQNYLLTEDYDLLMRRTLPSMGSMLTRSNSHIHSRFSIRSESEGPINKELEYTPIGMGNAAFEGAYLMSRGQMPVYRNIAKSRFMNTNVESAGMNLKNTTDYYWYERANGSETFPLAIANADEYLIKRSFLSSDKTPDLESFINISYTPQFQAQLDAYEITGDTKYLEGAVEGARRFLPSLRITDIPESKDVLWIENTEQLVAEDKQRRSSAWSIADRRYRRGALMEATGSTISENGSVYNEYIIKGYDENYMNVRDMTQPYPAWVTSRTGLGVEQFSTCLEGANITMSTWAGDVLRLGYLSGDELMMDLARSSLVGRFANYPGYYIRNYTTIYGLENYPTEAFDSTYLYFHHAPVLLSAIHDYLFSNAYVKSDGKVNFPNTRIQGYAWFNNRMYGHEPGVIYDEKEMWPWLKEGTIEVSSKQIDWIAGRNEGRAAFVLTNAGDNTENITVAFNADLGIKNGAVATIYDKTGNAATTVVKDNKLTVAIPEKGIVTVAVSGSGIHMPEYAKIVFNETAQNELGTSALGLMYEGRDYEQSYSIQPNNSYTFTYDIDKGYDVKAYALALAPDNYMGYIFVGGRSAEQYEFINEQGEKAVGGGDGNKGIIKTTLKWRFEGESDIKTEIDENFPYEFFIPVTDRNKKIVFNVETEYQDGIKTLDKEYTIAPQEITVYEPQKYTFEPISMSIVSNLGGVSSPLTTGKSKYCIQNQSISFFPFNATAQNALKDCYLSGYLKVKDLTSTTDVIEKGYVLFDNVPIVNSVINTSASNRLDFSVNDIIYTDIPENTHEYKNGTYIGALQGTVVGLSEHTDAYEWGNLYITNADSKKGLQFTRNGNTYTLSNDGACCLFVAVATYSDQNQMLDARIEQVIVSINNSKSYTISNNQKLFVWECDVNKGTSLCPVFSSKSAQ
ncbi:MAG: hypothetical protein IJE10_07580 [Clostridia bacterium]|nr:hypothetical protein [Clostridia bacterium]